jgi:hypothetical protein
MIGPRLLDFVLKVGRWTLSGFGFWGVIGVGFVLADILNAKQKGRTSRRAPPVFFGRSRFRKSISP